MELAETISIDSTGDEFSMDNSDLPDITRGSETECDYDVNLDNNVDGPDFLEESSRAKTKSCDSDLTLTTVGKWVSLLSLQALTNASQNSVLDCTDLSQKWLKCVWKCPSRAPFLCPPPPPQMFTSITKSSSKAFNFGVVHFVELFQ